MYKHRKSHSNYSQNQPTFMEDLQQSLLPPNNLYGLQAFQRVFNKKKLIGQMIERQKKAKEDIQTAYIRAKQRIAQIEQLQGRVDKQTALLQTQIQKINDSHTMNKILMMEKILKLQKQNDDMERKRSLCERIKGDSQRSSFATMARKIKRLEKVRLSSLSRTLEVKQQAQQKKEQLLEQNRRKAESVRLDRERRKNRLIRMEQYKLERAHKNYATKIQTLRQTLQSREYELDKLAEQEQKQSKHLKVAEKVTKQYLNTGFFATATIQ